MYFRAQRKLQGEVSLSDPIETDREGNALELIDIVGTEDTLLEDLHQQESARKLRRLVGEVLTAREALYLAAALSLDSLVSGFGAGLDLRHPGILLCCTFFLHLAAVGGGCALGRKLAHRQELNISWLGGAMLILLALLRLA